MQKSTVLNTQANQAFHISYSANFKKEKLTLSEPYSTAEWLQEIHGNTIL